MNNKSHPESFILKNNQMLNNSKVNQTIVNWIFDTSASSTTIFNENLINDLRRVILYRYVNK